MTIILATVHCLGLLQTTFYKTDVSLITSVGPLKRKYQSQYTKVSIQVTLQQSADQSVSPSSCPVAFDVSQ